MQDISFHRNRDNSNNSEGVKKPLKVCILACVFWPISVGFCGRHAVTLAETLTRIGHKVTVVTTFPAGGDRKLFRHKLIAKENLNGIKIIRVPALLPSGPGIWKKLMLYLSFNFTSLLALPLVGNANLILGLHPPPVPYLLFPGFLFSRILRCKYIIRITDLWPDQLFEYDIATSKPARKVVTFISIAAYKLADHIMAFTPKIKSGIMKHGIPGEKISVVEMAVDTSTFRPIPGAMGESANLGLQSSGAKFIVLYSGAFALTYDFDSFLEAAKTLERYQDILFVLLGDGDSRDHIIEKISQLELKNVVRLPPVTEAELVAKYINCSDVCVIPLKPEMLTNMLTRPSKTFEFWACGKPVITCSKDELPTLIEESQAGIALEPRDPKALAEAIEFLYLNRDVALDMGKRGREFVSNRFSYKVLETNLREVIEQVILTK